jgi:WD40 repeat protein
MKRLCLLLLILAMHTVAAHGQAPKPEEPPVPTDPMKKPRLTLDPGHHTTTIVEVLFTPDNKTLISVGLDHSVQIWDVQTGERRRVMRPFVTQGPLAAALAPDGKTLLIASHGFRPASKDDTPVFNMVCLLNLEDGRMIELLDQKKARWGHHLSQTAFAADGDRAFVRRDSISFVWTGLKGVWDRKPTPASLQPSASFAPEGDAGALPWLHPTKGQPTPDGTRLALRIKPSEIQIWNFSAPEKPVKERSIASNNGPVAGMAWSPDGKRLATVSVADDGNAKVIVRVCTAEGKELKSFDLGGFGSPRDFAFERVFFRSDNELFMVGQTPRGGNRIRVAVLVNLETGTVRDICHTPIFVSTWGAIAALSPDGKHGAVTCGPLGSQIALFKVEENTKLRFLAGGRYGASHVGWSPAGYSVARNANNPNTLDTALDLKTLQLSREVPGTYLKQLIRRPDGWELQGANAPGGYVLRLLRNGTPVAQTPVEGFFARSATMAHKGDVNWFVKAASAGMFMYDAKTGKMIHNFRAGGTQSVATSHDDKYLLSSQFDQVLIIRDVEGKKILLSVFIAGEDWIAWTPEGYYAATPGGERLMGWMVLNGLDHVATFHPAERFRKQLYRPDVIKLVLEKGGVAEALKAADAALKRETRDVQIDRLLPPNSLLTVLDQSKMPTIKVKVQAEAMAKDQPITSLRLLVDGRPLPGKKTFVEYEVGKQKVEVEWTFEIPEGEHQIAVLARGPDSSSISRAIRLKHVDIAKLPVMHVLAVGINSYRDKSLDLMYAAPDARALSAAFATHCKGQPFRDVAVKALLNEQATAENILKELLETQKAAAQQDLVVVFFACHGVKQKKEYYFLTHEADTDNLAKSSLSGSELRRSLADLSGRCQVLLIIDACYSAGFGESKKLAMLGLKPATDDATRDLTDDDCAVAVLCAAMGHEKAEGKDGHGLFTRAVLDVLEKKPGVPYNRYNQRIYVNHLYTYVLDEVRALSQNRQHPFLSLPWVVESFVVR